MSVIKITHHDENIFNIRKEETTFHKKSPRYISRFRSLAKEDYEKLRCRSYAHMGLAHYVPPDPRKFLKSKRPKITLKKCPTKLTTMVEEPVANVVQPCVPTLKECLEEERKRRENAKPPKNFVKDNKKEVVKIKPKPLLNLMVDTKDGHKVKVDVQQPKYIYNSDFGNMPNYLKKFVAEKQAMRQSEREVHGTEQPKCKYIVREEREELLAGLKQNWAELQKKYQGLPILTDTIPKINRKSKMEADLKQLEKDIVMIERHPYIYVYNEDDLN